MNAEKVGNALLLFIVGGLAGAALTVYGLMAGGTLFVAAGGAVASISQMVAGCLVLMTFARSLDAIQGTTIAVVEPSPATAPAKPFAGRKLGKPEL